MVRADSGGRTAETAAAGEVTCEDVDVEAGVAVFGEGRKG